MGKSDKELATEIVIAIIQKAEDAFSVQEVETLIRKYYEVIKNLS